MGCNTSQELKTKDGGPAATAGGEGDTNTNAIENGGNIVATANGEQQGNESGTGGTTKPSSATSSSSAKNHSNYSKSNSIITTANKADTSAAAASASYASLKHNGVFSAEERQCDKAEITELNDMDLGDDEAATKIQAAYRGHKVRTTMRKSETKTTPSSAATAKTTTMNNANVSATNKNVAASAAEAADPTKAELEAEFDPNDKELCDAALKIQAAFRGHLTRKVVNKDAPDDVDIQEITKKVAEELDIDLTDPELNKAATKIQASFRGHKIRKDVANAE